MRNTLLLAMLGFGLGMTGCAMSAQPTTPPVLAGEQYQIQAVMQPPVKMPPTRKDPIVALAAAVEQTADNLMAHKGSCAGVEAAVDELEAENARTRAIAKTLKPRETARRKALARVVAQIAMLMAEAKRDAKTCR